MVLFEGTLDLAIGILLIVALAEWGKYRQHHQRPFRILGGAGFFFAIAAAFKLPEVLYYGIHASLSGLFQILGEISALVAAFWLVYEILQEWSGKKVKKLF